MAQAAARGIPGGGAHGGEAPGVAGRKAAGGRGEAARRPAMAAAGAGKQGARQGGGQVGRGAGRAENGGQDGGSGGDPGADRRRLPRMPPRTCRGAPPGLLPSAGSGKKQYSLKIQKSTVISGKTPYTAPNQLLKVLDS